MMFEKVGPSFLAASSYRGKLTQPMVHLFLPFLHLNEITKRMMFLKVQNYFLMTKKEEATHKPNTNNRCSCCPLERVTAEMMLTRKSPPLYPPLPPYAKNRIHAGNHKKG